MKLTHHLFGALLSVIFFLTTFAGSANAIYIESGKDITLPADKLFQETVIIGGSLLTIDSDIDGDLICAGQSVTVNGDIRGDILCAGENLKINGNVDGNIRVAGRNIEISGRVAKNLTSVSQNLSLTKFSTIKGDILFGGQLIDLRGSLGRDLLGGGETISLTGNLSRNALVTGTRITVADPASVGGNFEYYVDNTGVVSLGDKNIKGDVIKHLIEVDRPEPQNTKSTNFSIVPAIFGMLSYFLLGLAIIYFLRKGLHDRASHITNHPFQTALIGFATLILTPIAAIILMITVIGIPFGIVLMLEYALSLLTGSIYPSYILGGLIVKNLAKAKRENPVLSMGVGVVAMGILLAIPVVNFFVGLIVICLGLGSVFLSYLPANQK